MFRPYLFAGPSRDRSAADLSAGRAGPTLTNDLYFIFIVLESGNPDAEPAICVLV